MTRHVQCVNPDCGRRGVVVNVPDRPVARGIVLRPGPLHCAACDWAVAELPRGERQSAVEEAVRTPPENTARRTKRR